MIVDDEGFEAHRLRLLALLKRLTTAAERAVPYDTRIESFLRAEQPDLLLLTPLLYFGSQQVDYVRAARALGIRTAGGAYVFPLDIEERLDDGQFDECDLTLRDLERIREAFVGQLLGMYHQRVAYPQSAIVELESRRHVTRLATRVEHRGRTEAVHPGAVVVLGEPGDAHAADAAAQAGGMLPQGAHIMPWRIEDRLRERPAVHVLELTTDG